MDSYGVSFKLPRNMRINAKLHYLSYFLTLTSFQPLYGKLSDIFGRKPCLLLAYTIFGLSCLFCGLAGSMEQLITARVCETPT